MINYGKARFRRFFFLSFSFRRRHRRCCYRLSLRGALDVLFPPCPFRSVLFCCFISFDHVRVPVLAFVFVFVYICIVNVAIHNSKRTHASENRK